MTGKDDKSTVKDQDAKDEDAKTADQHDDATRSGGRGDVSGDQQVQERDDIGAAALPDGPDEVKVITEVRPGVAN